MSTALGIGLSAFRTCTVNRVVGSAQLQKPITVIGHSVPSFAEFTATWIDEKAVEWRASYAALVHSLLSNHVLPDLGVVPVDQLHRGQLMAFRAQLATKASANDAASRLTPSTVNRIMSITRAILAEASLRYGFPNPAREIRNLRVRRGRIEPLSLPEIQRILQALTGWQAHYITVRAFAGLRSAEINGLKWRHVDFERGVIEVRETFSNGLVDYTKNDSSQRDVLMSAPVRAALAAQRELVATGLAGYVFCARNGSPIDNNNFDRRVWRPLLAALRIPGRRLYQLRHTCATLWLAAGENPEWIARQLGHTTTAMLFQVYSRYVPNLTRQDGSAMDALLSRTAPGLFPSPLEMSSCL